MIVQHQEVAVQATVIPIDNEDLLNILNQYPMSSNENWFYINIQTVCCKKVKSFIINGVDLLSLEHGNYLNPERYSADERELIISGVCSDHWAE